MTHIVLCCKILARTIVGNIILENMFKALIRHIDITLHIRVYLLKRNKRTIDNGIFFFTCACVYACVCACTAESYRLMQATKAFLPH